MSRRENAPTTLELERLTGALIDIYYASYAEPPVAVTVEIDEMVDNHGSQPLSFCNGHMARAAACRYTGSYAIPRSRFCTPHRQPERRACARDQSLQLSPQVEGNRKPPVDTWPDFEQSHGRRWSVQQAPSPSAIPTVRKRAARSPFSSNFSRIALSVRFDRRAYDADIEAKKRRISHVEASSWPVAQGRDCIQ